MRFYRFIFAVLLLMAFASAALASPSMTFGGKQDPQSFRWKAGPIKIYLSSSLTKSLPNIRPDSDVMGAIRRSLQAWSDAADIEFQIDTSDKQGVSPSGMAGDGINLITIAATPENVLFFTKDSQTTAAKTRLFYNRKGTITEADIVLNPFQQFSTDGTYGTFDLQSALTHEIGHLLGLRHSDVLGSTMSESLAKNAVVDPGDFKPRGLSDSDVAAVREIYGVPENTDECCSSISGKLTLQNGRPAKALRIWAEENETGRVVAQTETSNDGTFRLGGLVGGKYKVFARSRTGVSKDEFATVDLEDHGSGILNQKVTLEQPKLSLDFIGLDGKLGESAVVLSKGSEHAVFIGGKDLDAKSIAITLNTIFLHVDNSTIAQQDFGDGVSVISFTVTADPETPRGVYSIFVSNGGAKTSLIGALKVE